MKYFQLEELLKSEKAVENKISNCPSWTIVEHLKELVEDFLDPLRKDLGRPIVVSSGYRCPKLNNIVGGSNSSAHPLGYAADITCPSLTFNKFKDFVIKWVKENNVPFDQIITERVGGKVWLHVGLKNSRGEQRRQVLTINR